MINGNDINKIIKQLSDQDLIKLFNKSFQDKRFSEIASGKEGIVYKLGNYAVKIMKNVDRSDKEISAIKLLTLHYEFQNFINFYMITETKTMTVYVMKLAHGTLRDWYRLNHTDCDWISMFIQVLIAMYQMNNVLKIFHNDLKRKNVLYEKLVNPKTLIYNIEGKIYKLTTKYIFYISDFSHASNESIQAANISDEYFIKYELCRKIFTDYLSEEFKSDKYTIDYVKKYIFKDNKESDEFKQYIKEQQDKINKKFKGNNKMYNFIMKKVITSFGIEHNMIDIIQIIHKIKTPSRKVTYIVEQFDDKNIIKNINNLFELYHKIC